MATNEDESGALIERTGGRKPAVLVVDDNAQYGRLLELLSEKLGIDAHRVACCDEGVVAIRTTKFDVILMDWLMPEVDGPMCTGRIRELEKELGRSVPIIGVTGHIKVSYEHCLEAGMDDFLAIPFTIEQLAAKISYWLKEK
jgi:two-component system sensor histidine kinase/response regulator